MIELSVDPPVIPAAGSGIVAVLLRNDGPLACTNLFVALDVPAGLGLEKGRRWVELTRLGPGEVHEHPLRLHPPEPGAFVIGIPNLSFRDGYGLSCRYRDRALELLVGAPVIGPSQGERPASAGRPHGTARPANAAARHPSIFLSYRRSDTEDIAGLLAAELAGKLPGMRVFHDHPSIRPGEDWPTRLARELDECAVLIALVGPTWLTAGDGPRPRIDDPNDPVRNEIATALRRGIPVLPVLFRAAMPQKEQLPDEIRDLTRRQGLRLDPTRYGECILQTAFAVRALIDGSRGRHTGPDPGPVGGA